MNEARSANVPGREGGIVLAGGNDAELDEPVDVVDRYARALSDFLTRVSAHDLPW
jgi:hypothetical protein